MNNPKDLTWIDINVILWRDGIKMCSEGWGDYIRAIRLVFQDEIVEPSVYERHVDSICVYLNL